MYRIASWFDRQTNTGKVLFAFGVIAAFLFVIVVFGLCSGAFISALRPDGDEYTLWYWGFVSPQGKPITLLLSLFVIVMTLSSFHHTYKNSVRMTDDRGVHFMEESTYGSSRWLMENEIPRSFTLQDINYTSNTIYGQVEGSKHGEKVVSFKPNEKGGEGNRNVLMLATMGTGKSFTYVRTELIQAAIRGDSTVTTDPSAELYTDLGQFFRQRGIDVKVLNLDNPQYSDFWNMLDEVIDPETERIDALRLNEFASVFIKNSAPLSTKGASEDPYFVPSAENLMKAIIGCAAWLKENPIIQQYLLLYKKITGKDTDAFIQRIEGGYADGKMVLAPEHVGFPECRREIIAAAKEKGYSDEKLEELKDLLAYITLHASTNKLNISTVYNLLKYDLEKVAETLQYVPACNPAKAPWTTFSSSKKDDVKAQIVQGLQQRMNLFDDLKLREVLSHDGIQIANINKKQSAYFVIMSDKSVATKPIASLFFSFLFKDSQENWDNAAQVAKERGTSNPCKNLVAMLDEFFSIGVIGGSPDAFGITMSNSRKRHIYISIILQVYSQLAALYGKDIGNVIQGGCDTILFLGANDPSTCEFISEFVSGEATILAEMHKKPGGFSDAMINTDSTMRQDRRYLLTQQEARAWHDKVLVAKRGELPLKLDPLPWVEHPAYRHGLIKPQSVFSSIPKVTDKLYELRKQEEKENPYEEIKKKLTSFFSVDGAHPTPEQKACQQAPAPAPSEEQTPGEVPAENINHESTQASNENNAPVVSHKKGKGGKHAKQNRAKAQEQEHADSPLAE